MHLRSHSIIFIVLLVVAPALVQAQDIVVNSQGDARLIDEPSGNRGDNNGGNTISGGLIGTNPGMVDNLIIHDFADLSAVAGTTVSGAVVTVNVNTGFSAGTHGSDLDTIVLSEIALGNRGWDQGNDNITGADDPAIDGSASFLFRETFVGGVSAPWVDGSGSDVANLRGALTTLGTLPGYNVGEGAPLVFTIDALTAQRWVDTGLGGLAMGSIDNGDGNGRFNLTPIVADNGATSIAFNVVPEPNVGWLGALVMLFVAFRRSRS